MSRQEQIDAAFDGIENSYHWIFDRSRSRLHKRRLSYPYRDVEPVWDDFSDWLTRGRGVYWINGKAGSGKSILMNYICNQRQTSVMLSDWASDKKLFTPTFFFWSAGSRLQSSIDGLLRSLLYQLLTQLLTQCQELANCFEVEPLHTWNENRLLAMLRKLLTQRFIPLAACIFIDGLDEFDGRYDAVLNFIHTLSECNSNIKICVSSRPLLAFEQALQNQPGLRLQDLTFDTISAYVNAQLSPLVEMRSSTCDKHDQRLAQLIIEDIVAHADCVFLWAVVVTREVREGLQDLVDLEQLLRMVNRLPSELNDLFLHILHNIKFAYQRDAATFLQITLHGQPLRATDNLDLCNFHFTLSQRDPREQRFSFQKEQLSQLAEGCDVLKLRIVSHTKGLIDVTSNHSPSIIYKNCPERAPSLALNVSFIHRSVRDFLCENEHAKSFLELSRLSQPKIHIAVARGTMARLNQFSGYRMTNRIERENRNPALYPFEDVLHHICLAERFLGEPQTELMQSLHYDDVARGYWADPYWHRGSDLEPYVVDSVGNFVDIQGMAGAAGMILYVCKQLGISLEFSRPSIQERRPLTNSPKYAVLQWKDPTESIDNKDSHGTPENVHTRFSLVHRLRLKSATGMSSPTHDDSGLISRDVILGYVLSCCMSKLHQISDIYQLIKVLAEEGASPMVFIGSYQQGEEKAMPFWKAWLSFLLAKGHAINGKVPLVTQERYDNLTDRAVALTELLDINRALITNGGDINYTIEPSTWYDPNLDFHIEGQKKLALLRSVSAMHCFDMCFARLPEYADFLEQLKPSIHVPAQQITSIYTPEPGVAPYFRDDNHHAFISNEQSEILMSKLDRWEASRSREAADDIQSMIEPIWRAQFPDVDLKAHTSHHWGDM